MLVEQAKVVLREVKILREMASNQGKEMSGPLHLGIIPTLGPYLLPLILPILNEEYPELELFVYELQTSQLVDQLESGLLDCAILAFMKESENFIEVPLFKEEMLMAVPHQHDWAKLSTLNIKQIKDKELLFLNDGHCLRTQTLDYCLSVGAKESSYFKATSLETLRNMVATNAGIALIPKLAAKTSDNLRYLHFTKPYPFRQIGMIYRPGSPLRMRYERLAKTISDIMRKEGFDE